MKTRVMHYKKYCLTILLLLFVAFIVFFAIRLVQRWNEWTEHGDGMVTLAKETMPDFRYNSHTDIHIEEFDDYGRYLFSVDNFWQSGFIIVQKEDINHNIVYYYADKSTVFVENTVRPTEKELAEIEKLKEENDWNKPLQEEKMTALPVD